MGLAKGFEAPATIESFDAAEAEVVVVGVCRV
jgi:hypothetical protein